METNKLELFNGKAYGVKVSSYGIENGYLDYRALAAIVGCCILNNTLRAETFEDWEMIAGDFNFDGEIYQDYIISQSGYKFLAERTDEIVFYNERLDIYVWGITHFGTGWDHVLTNVELI